ncbi:MAG: Gfo/Idh/MocA family oxidoreductase [Provencibacterium sp.]|nr:Gfo/Idh/MocA family oxidoreductase [Provencibacterium sp.]
MSSKITAIIVGSGHRSLIYSQYALEHPEEFQIVGVADPNPLRRKAAADMHRIPDDMCFESAEQLAQRPKLADAIINGTMDREHVVTSIPLLQLGYDMLLEKPFAINEEEMWELHRAVRQTGRKVMICHVLRYAPFYREIKQLLLSGEIGKIVNIQATEHVSYHHYSVAYLRGKWNNEEECGATMLLAKCCHDMDLIMWLKSGVAPRQVASFGGDFQFDPALKPAQAGTRCLVDCPIEKDCLYSAKKLHIDHPDRWSFYVWDYLAHLEKPTLEDKIQSLKTDNPHGLCAWDCGHAVVDHQSVLLQFSDSATATLNMIGGTAKPERNIHIIGTLGEIKGTFDDSIYTIRKIDHSSPSGWSEKTVDLAIGGDKSGMTGSHGGGDLRLVEDFVHVLQGREPSISCTSIDDSINGHLAVFLADRARRTGSAQLFPAL